MIQQIENAKEVFYPDSDGQPMGENTLQIKWIISVYNGLEAVFRERDDVFIAADLFWYPIRGDAKRVLAPDIMVAFGRPKGERRSYKQWEEGNVPPHVVLEILSPGNRVNELARKFIFYERFGVEEYYEYDPDEMKLQVWMRNGEKLKAVAKSDRYVSPRMGVRFEVPGSEPMRLVGPDGKPFRSYLELVNESSEQQERLMEETRRANSERKAAEVERKKTEAERTRAEKLAALLREHGIDPNAA